MNAIKFLFAAYIATWVIHGAVSGEPGPEIQPSCGES
jgi:hypothetical protein